MVVRPWPCRTEVKRSLLFHLTKGLWILISSSSSSQRWRSWWHLRYASLLIPWRRSQSLTATWWRPSRRLPIQQEADDHLLHRSYLSLTLIEGSSQLAFLLWGILVFVFKTWTQFRLLWICHCLLVWKKSTSLVFLFIPLQFSVRGRRGAAHIVIAVFTFDLVSFNVLVSLARRR